jgi:uncharacterized protein (UPF0248 family)
MSENKEAVLIEKEEIPNLKFPHEEVLTEKDDIKLRDAGLDRGMKLGNLEHNKICIVFKDSEGLKKVNTTVWSVTDQRIILKQGIVIPINRIVEVY